MANEPRISPNSTKFREPRCIASSQKRNSEYTITFDNGIEFSDWASLEERSGMTVYFAYPYHSWERWTNENTNGLLREFFPKKMDFNLITPDELAHVVRKLNNRERKRLGFLSPRRVFWKK